MSLQHLNVLQGPLPSLTEIAAERVRRSTSRALSQGYGTARERCKTLVGFIQQAWPILEPMRSYVHGKHIDLLCAHLEAITHGRLLELGHRNRLLINVPPGFMKSLLVSVLWPAWEWGPCGMPGLRIISTSYDLDNVRRDCRKMRELVASDWYQALWPVSLTRNAELDYGNTAMGERRGVAFSSLTGKRGDRLLIDDPHSTETAESDADRGTAIRIFRESVPLRVNDSLSSAIVIIMQRLHQHDVSGVAMALKLGYLCIVLPMEFEADRKCETPLGEDWRTEEGELAWPERFPRTVIDQDKVPLGAYGIAGQFQQRPTPRGGLMFKRAKIGIIAAAPAGTKWVRGWDLAATKAKSRSASGVGPAYTAGVKLGRTPSQRWVVGHVVRVREDGPGVRGMILSVATQDGKPVEIDLPQDPGQAGKVQAQDFIAMLAGFTAYTSPESGDKIDRALPFAAQVDAGNVDLIEGPWNDDYLGELELFPMGGYKDQVDATSRAFARHLKHGFSVVVAPILVTKARSYFGDNIGG